MLPLMTTTDTHLSSHSQSSTSPICLFSSAKADEHEISATLVLHSLFPSLKALAHNANERSLEILENTEAKGVVDFLDVEFVFGG